MPSPGRRGGRPPGTTVRLFQGDPRLSGIILGSGPSVLGVLNQTPGAGDLLRAELNSFIEASPHRKMLVFNDPPKVVNVCATVRFDVTSSGVFPPGPITPDGLIKVLEDGGLTARPAKGAFRAVKASRTDQPKDGFGAMTLAACSHVPHDQPDRRVLRGRLVGCASGDNLRRFFAHVVSIFKTDGTCEITNGVLKISCTPLIDTASKLPGMMLGKTLVVEPTTSSPGGKISGAYNIGTVMSYFIAAPPSL